MKIRKKRNPKPCPFRPHVYHLYRGKKLIARCTDEDTAKFLASLMLNSEPLLTNKTVSGTIPQQKQGA